ncbi:MAG: hypothetical protein ACYTHM_15730, partial [Planctomycetota bacterium]
GQGPEGAAEVSPGTEKALVKKIMKLESQLDKVQKELEKDRPDPKPKFDQFAAKLGLDEGQQAAVKEMLVKGQEELLDHFSRPLPDGTIVMDELADAFYQSMVEPEKGKAELVRLYTRLISEKVPGTDQTYAQVGERLNTRLSREMATVMTASQAEQFRTWAPKPTEIELSEGPFQRYILAHIQRRQQTPGEGASGR